MDYRIQSNPQKDHILIDSIHRFKGLESQIIFLWGLKGLDFTKKQALLYVGMTRAKSQLIFVGDNELNYLEKIISD